MEIKLFLINKSFLHQMNQINHFFIIWIMDIWCYSYICISMKLMLSKNGTLC